MIFRSNSNRKEREYNPLIHLANKRWTYGHTCICGCCMPVLGIRFLFSPLDITNSQTRILTHRNPGQNENTTSHDRRGRRSMHSSLRKSYQFGSNSEWSIQRVRHESIVVLIHLGSHLMAKPLDPVCLFTRSAEFWKAASRHGHSNIRSSIAHRAGADIVFTASSFGA